MSSNTTEIGNERERELLGYIRQTRRSPDMADVPDPDRHIDAENGRAVIPGIGLEFDFCWRHPYNVLLELDGGQSKKGGGRHNSDEDRWKTLEAQALGWTVLHVSYTMLKRDPWRVMRILADVLARKEGT